MSLNTRVEYGEDADLEEDRSTAQTVSRSRQFYAPVVPDVSSRGRLHNIKVQGSLLFVTYTIIQGIISSEM